MKGYQQAEVIDGQIGKLLEKHAITEENAREWLSFCRTISTTLDFLTMEAKEILLPKGSNGKHEKIFLEADALDEKRI